MKGREDRDGKGGRKKNGKGKMQCMDGGGGEKRVR